MMTKFSNLDDFFKFLDLKRAEISREFCVTEAVKVSEMTTEEPAEPNTIRKEQTSEIATKDEESPSISLDSQTVTDTQSLFSQKSLKSLIESELIQMAWSTSMETPQKATDTTMIMSNLNLNESEFDYNEEMIEDDLFESDAFEEDLFKNVEVEVEDLFESDTVEEDLFENDTVEDDLFETVAVDPLGLDSLAFPMSQFLKTTEAEFEDDEDENETILDEIISEFELDFDATEETCNEVNDEFDFDITMSQIPSSQVAQNELLSSAMEEASCSETPIIVGFKTGSGKSLPPPSKEAMKRARSLVEFEEEKEERNESEKENIVMPLAMFTTGRGKPMPPPSEEAVKRAKSLTEPDAQISFTTETQAMTVAFSTGRGKALPPPSKEAMDRASKLIEGESNVPVTSVGFSTGRGKVLPPPSKEAMDRASRIINDPVTTNTVGFSTGRGQALPAPSEEALKKAASLIGAQDSLSLNSTADIVKKTVNKTTFKPSVPGNTAFKPPSLVKSASSAAPPPKPFSLSNAWRTPRTRQPAKQAVKVEPVKLFDLSTDGMQRYTFKEFFTSCPNLKISDYTSYGIPMDILRMDSRSARCFKFSDGWGVKEAHAALLANGAQSVSISLEWTSNHYRWIIWKFVSILRCFPEKYSVQNLSPGWVLQQLLYRYEREIHQCHRSALKKIIERDDAAGKYLCLMVAAVDRDGRCLELSDGWYSIWTSKLDDSFWDLVEAKKRIFEGMKIEISGATLTGGQDGIPALEAASKDSQCRLMISRNSSRPARWDTKLGFICTANRAVAFLKHLHQVHPQGGSVPALSLIIDRVYPLLFREESGENKSSVVRNERDHYLYLETNPEQAANSKFTPIQRIKVVGNCEESDSFAVVSFWNPIGEDQRTLLQEGAAVIITNLRASTSKMAKLSLISAKSTRIFKDTLKKSTVSRLSNVVKIELNAYGMLTSLKLNESYDVDGIVLGRVGAFFWLGGLNPADDNTILICLKNFNSTSNNRGDVFNFRDLTFNYFDGREGVAHFTFTEYSDHKKGTVLKPDCFETPLRRFQHLTNAKVTI